MSNAAGFMFRKLLGSDEEFSWDMVAKNDAIGDMIGKYVTESFMSPEQIAERDRQEREAAKKQKNDFADMDFMDSIEQGIGGIFLSLKEDFGKTVQDAGKAARDIGRVAGKL